MAAQPPTPPIELAIDVAQAEVAVQATMVANLDTRGAAMLAACVGLIAIDVSVGSTGLGRFWWFPLLGLSASSLLFIVAISEVRFGMGPHLAELQSFAVSGPYEALVGAIASNQRLLRRKERMLARATWVLLGTVFVSMLVVLPTR